MHGVARAIEQAFGEFRTAPNNPHSKDALAALRAAQRELETAQACADAMARGLR